MKNKKVKNKTPKGNEVTHNQAQNLANLMGTILKNSKDSLEDKEAKTKLTYHIKKFTRQTLVPIMEEYSDELEAIRIDLCSTSEEGNITRDKNGEMVFTKENAKTLLKKQRALLSKSLTKVKIYDLPKKLHDLLDEEGKELFEGFINLTENTE